MLNNILPRIQLAQQIKIRAKSTIEKSVRVSNLQAELDDGWTLLRRHKKTARVAKQKTLPVHLEDRVWTLLFRMEFESISGDGGAMLERSPQAATTIQNQIDVVAIDSEVALAIECKSQIQLGKRPSLQDEIGKLSALRLVFQRAVQEQFPTRSKRQAASIFFLQNVILTDTDRSRAQEAGMILFDQHDLKYYESLVSHLGPAARYQFLSDVLPGRSIAGLSIRVPAVRSRMAGHHCYTFSVTPDYLLKIAYVSHRAKGRAYDVDTYQRMISRRRLMNIRRYISSDGVFPTNIVMNFDSRKVIQFDRGKQEGDESDSNKNHSVFGWLTLRPTYKSAWIIDGQHRLFAYSGHPRSTTGTLAVLAFEGLPASKQAELFININAEQKRVKQSLLQELYAELHWDSADVQIRIRAIISKTVQVLDEEPNSPFLGRILKTDEGRTLTRCISLTSMFEALDKSGFYLSRPRQSVMLNDGPLSAENNDATVRRTVKTLKFWFDRVKSGAPDWWELGAAEGGGLSMNDGVGILIDVLRSVFHHLQAKGLRLNHLTDDELIEAIDRYARVVASYFSGLTSERRRQFRALRGNEGHAAGLRHCQHAIHAHIADFNPPGLDDFLLQERERTTETAAGIVRNIEKMLQTAVIATLKDEYGSDEVNWFFQGVPKGVRKSVDDRINEDRGQRGGREENFDLIHYREIATQNWNLFQDRLAYTKTGNKDKRTQWIADVNEIRKITVHASRGASVTLDQLALIRQYEQWLKARLNSPPSMADDQDEDSNVSETIDGLATSSV